MSNPRAMSSWADDSDEETDRDFFERIGNFTIQNNIPPKNEVEEEEETEIIVLSDRDRKDEEAEILSDENDKLFPQVAKNTICNFDLTPLLTNNFPNPKFMETIAECFPSGPIVNGLAPPLTQKFFDALKGTKDQNRYVVNAKDGASFVVRREDYRDFSDDVLHQYFVMRLIQEEVWKKVPMIIYPFGIFSATRNCEYTGNPETDERKLYNFLITSYVPFNRTDKNVIAGREPSNDPAVRQMSFHVAMAPQKPKGYNPRLDGPIKPLLIPIHAWYLTKMMYDFLRFMGLYYLSSHGDAHYFNWYLRDLGEVQKVEIPDADDESKAKTYYTRYLPVLSDFGRSSVVVENRRYSFISKYYAVPPTYDHRDLHDLLLLLYSFVKNLDRVIFNPQKRNAHLIEFFQNVINRFSLQHPSLKGFDIVNGKEGKGTSFAEMARMLSKPDLFIRVMKNGREVNLYLAEAIFDAVDARFGGWKPDTRGAKPLNPSTVPVRSLNVRCPPMRQVPPSFPETKTSEEQSRLRSENIIFLREEEISDEPMEESEIEDILENLISYMELSIASNTYEAKEGLIIEKILARLAKEGMTSDKFPVDQKEIYDQFIKFKLGKDLEQRELKRDVLLKQSELVERAPVASSHRQPDEEGFRRQVSFGRRR